MIGRVEVDQTSLTRLVAALRAESDGKALASDLVERLRKVAEPAVVAARAAILAMPSPAETTRGPGLRAAVADRIRIHVRTTGRNAGVAVRAHKRGMPRGFHNAPKRLNARHWRRQVFGREWVTQVGEPGWFDDTLARHRPAARRAAKQAMEDMAHRISTRTKG